jgi:hypothetical protein
VIAKPTRYGGSGNLCRRTAESVESLVSSVARGSLGRRPSKIPALIPSKWISQRKVGTILSTVERPAFNDETRAGLDGQPTSASRPRASRCFYFDGIDVERWTRSLRGAIEASSASHRRTALASTHAAMKTGRRWSADPTPRALPYPRRRTHPCP